MTVPLTPSAVERIDEVCDRFEAAWKAGQEPRLEDYLHPTPGPEREALLQELVRVETHYRRKADAAPTVVGHSAGPGRGRPFVAGYELLGELGRGGMGIVYKARQLRPNRLVALKMISAGTRADARELERFRREAEALAQLQDPHIVQVYEVGEQDGQPYFALEYVAGGSLDRYLGGTPQPPRAAAELAQRLAHAIHHAHQRGIIHRDLKPANILLVSGEGVSGESSATNAPHASPPATHHSPLTSPKITDFGLAKLLDAAAGTPTQSGDLLGTPSYMAPEQVGGTEPISAATDVYGLGAILYELLTGRPPFRAETTLETVLQVQTVEPVSPSRLQPKCPRDLVTICLKCLGKQPRQRYASALELAEDLGRFLEGQPIRARPVGPLQHMLKWTRRQPMVAALIGTLVAAIALGVGAGSWLWWRAEEGWGTAESALGNERAALAAQEATLDRHRVALAHREWLANNGARAEALLEECTPQQRRSWEWRYLDRMRHAALRTLHGHSNIVQAVAVHPEGGRVASASHDLSVRSWDLDTGRGTVLGTHQYPALTVVYSPDGRLLASAGSNDGVVKLWDAKTGAELPGFMFGGKEELAIWSLAFDRSSRYLAAGGKRRFKVWDTHDGKVAYDRVAHPGAISKVAFSPDGRYLATAMFDIKVWAWTTNASKPALQWPGHASGIYDLAFSPDGDWLASGGRDGLVRVHSFETKKEEFTLNAHQLSVTSLCFSPDGQRLASAGQEGDMHVWNFKERRRLFTLHGHSGTVWDLIYTPDGSRLVSAGHDSLIRVWDAAAGQEALALPVEARAEVSAVTYSPNGRLLAWGDINGRIGVWDTVLRQEIHGLDEPKLRSASPAYFAFSPDSRRLAWRGPNGPATLWDLDKAAEVTLPAQRQVKLLGLAFSADGKRLLAASFEDEKLQVHDLYTGEELLALARPGRRIYQVVWSPDASCLVTNEDRRCARLWATDTGRPLGEVEYQPSLTSIAFSADGRLLAVGGVDGGVSVWDVKTCQQTMAAPGPSSRVFGLALSPDGSRLASTGSDCTAKLWDTQTGHEVLTLRTQLHERSPLAFSPDGADLASVSTNNHLQIWSAKSQ